MKMKGFFKRIDYPTLGKSFQEVLWMTCIALIPLMINITLAALPTKGFIEAFKTKVLPSEILSYCLSFIAPSLYLLTKTNGSSYKLPFLHTFSSVTIIIYLISMVLYLVTKNHWIVDITGQNNGLDLYLKLTLYFLGITIAFRIYAVYHGRLSSRWPTIRESQQNDFNARFTESLK